MNTPRTASQTTDEPTTEELTVGGLTAEQARRAVLSLDDIYTHETPRVVRYHGSKIEHHGLTWLVASCHCVSCWREPWGRAVLVVSALGTSHVESLVHVRWESFTDA